MAATQGLFKASQSPYYLGLIDFKTFPVVKVLVCVHQGMSCLHTILLILRL